MSELTGDFLAGHRGMCPSVSGAAENRAHAQKCYRFPAQSTPKTDLALVGLELSAGYAVTLTSTLQTSRVSLPQLDHLLPCNAISLER